MWPKGTRARRPQAGSARLPVTQLNSAPAAADPAGAAPSSASSSAPSSAPAGKPGCRSL